MIKYILVVNINKIQKYLKDNDLLNSQWTFNPCEDKNPKPNLRYGSWQNKHTKDINLFTLPQLSFRGLIDNDNLVCFDIDSKNKNGFDGSKRKRIEYVLNDLSKRINKIFCETSTSGEAYHLFALLTDEQLKCGKETIFKKVISHEIANKLEFFNGVKKHVVTYPSKGCKLIGNSKSLNQLDYLSDEEYEILLSGINKIKSICGDCKERNKTIYRNNKKSSLTIKTDDELNAMIKNSYNNVVKIINNIINEMDEDKKTDFIKKLLEKLNIEYYDNSYRINIYSLLYDDGSNPDSYIFYNKNKKTNFIYYDFHNNNSYNLINVLYFIYADKLLSAIENILSIKLKIFKRDYKIIEVNTQKELEEELNKAINSNEFKKIMVVASTGFGKTTTIKKLSNKHKIVMFEPLFVQVNQEYKNNKDFNMGFLAEDIKTAKEYHKLIFSTFDQYKFNRWLSNNRIVVIDECHSLCSDSYRNTVITSLYNGVKNNKCVFMTATDDFVYIPDIDLKIIAKGRKINKKFMFDLRKSKILDKIISNIIEYESSNHWVYIDNKNSLELIFLKLKDKGFNDVELITSEDDLGVNYICNNSKLNSKIILSTRKLSAGFHLFNDEKWFIHTTVNDVNVLNQLINRFRLDNDVILYIYSSYNSRKRLDLDWIYAKVKKESEEFYLNSKSTFDSIPYSNENTYYGEWNNRYSKFDLFVSQYVYKKYMYEYGRNIAFIKQSLLNHNWEYCGVVDYNKKVTEIIEEYDVCEDKSASEIYYELISKDYKEITKILNKMEKKISARTLKKILLYKILKMVKVIKKFDLEAELEDFGVEERLNDNKLNIIWREINRLVDIKVVKCKDENIIMDLKRLEAVINKLKLEYITTDDKKILKDELLLKSKQLSALLQELGYIEKVVKVEGKSKRVMIKQ